jgi:dihydrofolate synthase/folylpolyglutamate synthase
MTFPETFQYLESLINYERIPAYPYKESLKLERIKDFLSAIDNPQDSLRCIHVAGTKGKGSTCAFLTYILRQAGYRVGLYTSPHLSDFRERIRVLSAKRKSRQSAREFEGMISKKELAALVERLKPAIEKNNKNSQYGPLSFFEVYTALAFAYFQKKKVDFAVLETGLGGRLDATNVVEPLVCAITPISYEHTQKLGNTLTAIAAEKSGIIKVQSAKLKAKNLVVISAPQEQEARKVIRDKCKEVGVKLYEVNKDIFYEGGEDQFSILGVFSEYPHLKINLLGTHQLINATVAVAVAEALRAYDIYVDIDSIRAGLYNTVWPGRCEVIQRQPFIVLDGAQNIASSRVLKETIKKNFQYKRLILVLGISNDKDIKGICKDLAELADTVILTQAENPRATAPGILAGYFNGKAKHITNSVEEAKQQAISIAGKQDLILVTGSLFVVGEARELF